MEKYTKLVRDRIPEIMDKAKAPHTERIASPEELEGFLFDKLDEEFAEFKEAKSPEELADMLEVIRTLIQKVPRFAQTEEIRQAKNIERGGFDKGIIMTGEKYK